MTQDEREANMICFETIGTRDPLCRPCDITPPWLERDRFAVAGRPGVPIRLDPAVLAALAAAGYVGSNPASVRA